jgi:hypothetical protein
VQGAGFIAIFPAISTLKQASTTSSACARFGGTGFRRRSRICVMQQAVLLFRSAPSRLGRRLAALVAIAAASLPDVGA